MCGVYRHLEGCVLRSLVPQLPVLGGLSRRRVGRRCVRPASLLPASPLRAPLLLLCPPLVLQGHLLRPVLAVHLLLPGPARGQLQPRLFQRETALQAQRQEALTASGLHRISSPLPPERDIASVLVDKGNPTGESDSGDQDRDGAGEWDVCDLPSGGQR